MFLINSAAADVDPAEIFQPDMSEWFAYDKELQESGAYVSGEALADLVTATSIRVNKAGEKIVTDGPFAETREVLGGFYVIDVPDLDAALAWAQKCPGARGGGAVVVRPVADFG
jgi:hypothetical protein